MWNRSDARASEAAGSGAALAVCRGVGALVAFTGVALLFLVEHGGPDEFVFFTTQSNLLVGCCLLWGAVAQARSPAVIDRPPAALRGAVTLYILVTLLVFHLVLANPASGFGNGSVHFGTVQNVLLHTVTPLLALLDWVLVRAGRARWWWPVGWLSYPLAYLAFVLVRGAIVHRYPYPFLDVRSIGYAAVATVSAGLLVVFLVLGLLVVALGRIGGSVARPPTTAGRLTPESDGDSGGKPPRAGRASAAQATPAGAEHQQTADADERDTRPGR